MIIKLAKAATIQGVKARANTIHDVVDRVAQKLIDRGYAALHEGKVTKEQEVEEDGATPSE